MASASEDDLMDTGGDDLFGSEDGDIKRNVHELSDHELDSGDDEQNDRASTHDEVETKDYVIGDSTIWRHPVPNPANGEFNSLRLPKFLGIDPFAFDPEKFELPTSDHHLSTKSANFSASATAQSTVRYRKVPQSGKLESNTNIYKWSDGSTTISVGDQHYELQTKPLMAPRDSKQYQEVMDSHSYVGAPSVKSQIVFLVGHMANQFSVRPNKNIEDDALEKLQKSLAAATRGGGKDERSGPQVITSNEDPELHKKKVELAEKERLKVARRREAAAEKARLPTGARRGGLSVDDLEGRSGRRAPAGRRSGGAKRPNRRPEYDSDDDLPRGRNREDEYDKEDDFLASSDEELEEGAEGDDDEELMEESEDEAPRAKRQKQSKAEESDADAEADLDDDEPPVAPTPSAPSGRGRNRNVVEDDDDE